MEINPPEGRFAVVNDREENTTTRLYNNILTRNTRNLNVTLGHEPPCSGCSKPAGAICQIVDACYVDSDSDPSNGVQPLPYTQVVADLFDADYNLYGPTLNLTGDAAYYSPEPIRSGRIGGGGTSHPDLASWQAVDDDDTHSQLKT